RFPDVSGRESSQTVGESGNQPIRHLAAGEPTGNRWPRSVRGTIRRRKTLVERGLGGLPQPATLLADRPRKAEFSEAPGVVGQRKHQETTPLAGTVHQPRGWRGEEGLAGEGDRRSNRNHAAAEGHGRRRAFQHETPDEEYRWHRRPSENDLCGTGPGPR